MNLNVKQVIVIRKDLGMRRGKEIAQGAHASMAFLAQKVVGMLSSRQDGDPFSEEEKIWLTGLFTKVCVRVDSEAELLTVAEAARAEGLRVEIITDAGKTEFNGVPTRTCLAVGPDLAEKVDKVTGHLKLY